MVFSNGVLMHCMFLIREAGGAFGKRQATKEEEYFRKMVTAADTPCLSRAENCWDEGSERLQ